MHLKGDLRTRFDRGETGPNFQKSGDFSKKKVKKERKILRIS